MELGANIQTVLGELLPQLLKNSTTSDLIEFRLVSREWRRVATHILLKRGTLKIAFQANYVPPFQNSLFISHYKPDQLRKWRICCLDEVLPDSWHPLAGGRTITGFCKVLKSAHTVEMGPGSSPFNNFEFYPNRVENVDFAQLDALFSLHGPEIKTLTLHHPYGSFKVGQAELGTSLLKHTPNLESLNLVDFSLQGFLRRRNELEQSGNDQNVNNPRASSFLLKKLKYIEISDDVNRNKLDRMTEIFCFESMLKILPKLFHSAPQLERVSFPSNFDFKLLPFFLPSKIELLHITSMSITGAQLFSVEGTESLETFAKAIKNMPNGIGLRRLQIGVGESPGTPDIWNRGAAVLRQILEATAEFLQEIELAAGAAWMLHKVVGLPVLPQVHTMKVLLNWWPYRPPGLSFVPSFDDDQNDDGFHGNLLSQLLPRLETVDLLDWHNEVDKDYEMTWFPFWNDQLPTVRTVKAKSYVCFIEGISSHCYSLASKLCPETETFTTEWYYHHFSLFAPQLWDFEKLTSLCLHISMQLAVTATEDSFASLDSAFTGFSVETVETIYKHWEATGKWEIPKALTRVDKQGQHDWDVLRINPSILNLRNLQKLRLEFQMLLFHTTRRTLVSGVSAKFGFEFMKNLKVDIRFQSGHTTSYADPNLYCKDCLAELNRWKDLHRPLSSFSNVTVQVP